MEKHINLPYDKETADSLKAGDYVFLTGTIYTARDAAHKRMDEALDSAKPLPIALNGAVIYYMGPSPAREGRPIGSAGPTTATRMDKYAPRLLDLGLSGMIGKGKRQPAVKEAIYTKPPYKNTESNDLYIFEFFDPWEISHGFFVR